MALNVLATYIGGPTAIIEIDGIRFLTDPTFDPAGSVYETPVYTLRKSTGPALSVDEAGNIDAVLLSHDHHFDNLDRAGRAMLPRAGRVFVPPVGAERLGSNATGLSPWETVTVSGAAGQRLSLTGTPARHGPVDGDRGPVTGFSSATSAAQRRMSPVTRCGTRAWRKSRVAPMCALPFSFWGRHASARSVRRI